MFAAKFNIVHSTCVWTTLHLVQMSFKFITVKEQKLQLSLKEVNRAVTNFNFRTNCPLGNEVWVVRNQDFIFNIAFKSGGWFICFWTLDAFQCIKISMIINLSFTLKGLYGLKTYQGCKWLINLEIVLKLKRSLLRNGNGLHLIAIKCNRG